MENNFSFFEDGITNTIPKSKINMSEFLEMLKNDTTILKKIREEEDKKKRRT